jgi:protein gp37
MAKRFGPQAGEWPNLSNIHTAAHDPRCFISTTPCECRDSDGKYLRTTPYPKGFAPTMHNHKLGHLRTADFPRRIFVGSMCDLFGEWVPDEWLAAIFRECHEAPQHVYMFLTKNPERYLELGRAGLLPEGDNYWYGTTATTSDEQYFFSDRHNTFVSIEPVLGHFEVMQNPLFPPKWVIVGPMNGPGSKKHKPDPAWISNIHDHCWRYNIPLFMKQETASGWGGELKKHIPQAMLDHINRPVIIDWKNTTHNKVRVESVRDKKVCRQCERDVQGSPAWRISARYYICETCYEGGSV